MMKRSFIAGAILLSTGLLPFGVASAAAPDGDFSCSTVLSLTAVSPYTAAVLKRAENGLTYAREAGVANDFSSYLPAWALSMASAWAGLTDTTTQRTDAVEELKSVSACLHLDLTMIDCEIEKVRQELHAQTARGSFVAIIRLTSLVQFLNERRNQLVVGALDPQHPDATWGNRYGFDRPGNVWCVSPDAKNVCMLKPQAECERDRAPFFETLEGCTNNGSLPPSGNVADTGRICPFDADYAPASDTGFGCDIGLMEPRKAYEPVNVELEGLKAVNGALAAYRTTAVEVLKLQGQINDLFGTQTSSASTTNVAKAHLNAYGCGWTGGWCDDDITKQCISDDDCADTCVFSNKLCDANRAIRCTDDSQCGDKGPCVEANEPPLRAVRGNFSYDKDQLSILNSFLGTRSQQELSRVFRSDMQTAAEVPLSNPTLRAQRAKDDLNPLSVISRTAFRLIVQGWSRSQARSESMMYPQDVDAPLETSHALSDLHTNISELARIASQKDGVRDFVTRYAWFLRRSCIFRSCNMLLDQSIKLSTTDECFPYANGSYLDDTTNDPRWQKCKNAAKIP